MEVWSPDGRRLFATPVAEAGRIALLTAAPYDRVLSLATVNGTVRVKEESGHIAGHPVIVRAVTSEVRVEQELAEFLWFAGLAIPFVAVCSVLGGHWLLKRTFRPVDELVAGARRVSADRLDVRLPVANPRDEVGQIAEAFNATLGRLEESFEQMRRFTANASHELRTPLSALRASGQAALAGPADPDNLRDALGEMLEDAEQLGRLLNAMLLLAQADAGTVAIDRRPVALGELVADVASECEVLALEKQQQLRLDAEPGLAMVDPDVFRIAVANILHNAIRYGHPSTQVEVRTYRMDSAWLVEVSDSGPGIAPEHHSRLFERFYRVDAGRSRTVGGVGLGLAMARWSVEQHGGRIELESQVGTGSTFRVVVPM